MFELPTLLGLRGYSGRYIVSVHVACASPVLDHDFKSDRRYRPVFHALRSVAVSGLYR